MKPSEKSDARRTSRQKTWWWVGVILLLLVGGGSYWYFLGGGSSLLNPTTTQTGPEYKTAVIRRGDIIISASGSGQLVANRTADLNFSTSGQVTELNVKLGDQVSVGQVLARMGNTQTLEASIANYNLQYLQAQKTLSDYQNQADISLATAYQTWVVSKKTYDDALYTQQRTAYARCNKETNITNAAALMDTKNRLDEIGMHSYGTPQWVIAEAAYETAQANYTYCIAYTDDEKVKAQAALDVAKVTLDTNEATYNTLKAASGLDPKQLAVDEAQVEQAKVQLEKSKKDLEGLTLTAPIEGTVTYIAANQGAIVTTAKYITIADLSQPYVQISLNELDLNKLAAGNRVEILFDALSDQTLNGKVVQVEPQLVASGQNSIAQGLVELDPAALKAIQGLPLGLNGKVIEISKEAKNALLAPVEAVRDLGNKEYAVFVVDKSNKLRLKTVSVGLMDSNQAEILNGLNEGDVVTTGTVPTSR